MKVIFVFALAIASTYAALDAAFKEKVMEHLQAIGAECAAKENASGDDIAEIMARKMPSRKEGKCLMSCFNEKLGIQDADGKPNMASALASIEIFKEADADIYEKMKKVMETCLPQDTGDRCENAVQIMECGQRVGLELGLKEDMLM